MKRSIKSLLLILCLCVVTAGYLVVQNSSQQETNSVNQTEGTYSLLSRSSDELTGISYSVNGIEYRFIKNEGVWQVENQPAFPLDTEAVESMALSLSGLTGTRKLTEIKSLTDYGLTEPAYSVEATWQDGSATTCLMGNATPFEDGYYVYLKEDPSTVYTVAASLSDTFSKTLKTLAVMETIPTVEHVTRIAAGGVLEAEYREESITFDPDQHWYTSADQLALDDTKISSLIDTANSLSFNTVDTVSPTDQDRADKGLAEESARKIQLYDGDQILRNVWIGNSTGSSSYYATLPESAVIYTISATDVDSILSITTDSLVASDLMPLTWSNLAEVSFTGEGISHTMSGGNGETAEDTEHESEQALWSQILSWTTDSLEEVKEMDEILKIHVTSINGKTRDLIISGYNETYYQIRIDDEPSRLIAADTVDKLIRTIKFR